MELNNRLATLSPEKLAVLERMLRAEEADRPPVSPRRPGVVPPLSFAQQRIWFLDRLQPGTPLYNVPALLRLQMSLDLTALEHTLREIVRRHEALRTTFSAVAGEPVQVISEEMPFDLPCIDLRALPPAAREIEARRVVVRESQRAFDLQRGPVFRALLIQIDDADYLLLFVLHHIVSDAWSMNVLQREIAALYGAFSAHRPSPLPALPVQYGDFSIWQRERLHGRALETLLAYWKSQLAGAPSVIDLPADRPRPRTPTFLGAIHPFAVPRAVTDELRMLCRREGVTLFMTLFAAFVALLHRYTGREDISIGAPIANRNSIEIEQLIGFFTNTLVLRARFDAGASFLDLLRRVKELTLSAHLHQDLPFEKLVEAIQPERSLSHNPLFQVLFTLERTSGSGSGEAGALPGPSLNGMAKFDLSLFMSEDDRDLQGGFELSLDLFDQATVAGMSGHFLTLLANVARTPEERTGELAILTPSEQRLVAQWSRSDDTSHDDLPVHRRFERVAARHSDAVAMIAGERTMSYGELNGAANRLARKLQKRGVCRESPVVLFVERSIEAAVAVLAVLKAGGAYLPIELENPEQRIQQLLAKIQPALVITQRRFADRIAAPNLLLLDEAEGDEPEEDLQLEVYPDQLAYVLHTSGSTGQPKGVAMSHRALSSLIAWQTAGSRPAITLQLASFGFDVSFQEMFSTWCSAGTLVFASDQTRRDPQALWLLIERRAVERVFMPYVALHQLAQAERPSNRLVLRELITAGEKLQISDSILDLCAALPGCTLANQYGPTETHVVSEHLLAGAPRSWPVAPPIGRPVHGAELWVLDRRLQPVPAGVIGELYVGGDSLARGYLGRPDLTAERFVPHPFSVQPGRRLYRTGDLVRWSSDGTLDFIGRGDEQVKVRGYRIELGEIEAVSRQHPRLAEAVAVVRGEGAEKLLVLFFTGDVAPEDLRSFLAERLPSFMLPTRFLRLESLPLTSSRKIDRAALAAMDGASSSCDRVGPRTPTEEIIAGIWADVLELSSVGVHDNFFALGGHSLSATKVVSRMKAALGAEILLRSIFETPTVAELASAHDQRAQTHRAPIISRLDHDDLLERVDQLSDEEVDAQLRSLIDQPASIEPVQRAEAARIRPLVSRLDRSPKVEDLSDAEVNRLLLEMLAAEGNGAP